MAGCEHFDLTEFFMGEAKRRKTLDPSFGKPKVLSLHQSKDMSDLDIQTLIPISLPLHQIPDGNWTEALEYLQKPWVKQARNIEEAYQVVKEVFWRVVLELIIKKKWLNNYQIPSGRAFQKLAEPKNEVLFHILELTIQCHSFASNEYPDQMPPTASCWFGLIFQEFKWADLESIHQGRINIEKEKRWQRQNIINKLEDSQNPYPLGSHTWHLINVAIPLAITSPQFEEKYWNPFIRAVRADVNHSVLDTEELRQAWIENGALYGSLSGRGKGSGKGKQLIWRFQ